MKQMAEWYSNSVQYEHVQIKLLNEINRSASNFLVKTEHLSFPILRNLGFFEKNLITRQNEIRKYRQNGPFYCTQESNGNTKPTALL